MQFGQIEIPQYALWLLGAAGALCSLLLRHWLQKSTKVSNNFSSASSKYMETVLGLFAGLYPHTTNWPENIDSKLRGLFPELQKAVTEFRAFLPWYKRSSFDKAWFIYRCATKREIDIQCYHHYMNFKGQPNPKDTFSNNVKRLLSYAKQT